MGHKPDKKQLIEIVKDFDNVMFCTVAQDGSIHARPMLVADVDERNRWWFITKRPAGKVDELRQDSHATVTVQSDSAFVTLSGRARLVSDERSIEDVWTPSLRAWFSQGPRDPDALLICFEPEQGEYWAQSTLDAVKLTLEKARAMATGSEVEPTSAGEHGTVAFQ